MAYEYSDLLVQARNWGEESLQEGWILEKDYQSLNMIDERTPDSLFSITESRPLIVAFLGGTGVGKSSLINRLAGKAIARTGVERPTSREVTVYHHRSVVLQHLPEKLPVNKIKMAQHDDERRKQVIWVDMPDMDSTEQKNKELVLEWIPHIDVLIYVVSPERYRDNKAWRMLLAEGGRHAWVFVINQWDRGQPEQYGDFIAQLAKAGFDRPVVLRTDCSSELTDSNEDEFNQLEDIIQQLANKRTIQQLELRGIQVRKEELKEKLEVCLQAFGPDDANQRLIEKWSSGWKETADVLEKGFDWPLQRLAVLYVKNEAGLLPAKTLKENKDNKRDKSLLWDDWAQSRFDDALDEVIQEADLCKLPVTPLKQGFLPMRQKAEQIVMTQLELAVRQALANPGNALQRFLLKFTGICATVLPVAVMGWVGYQGFQEYYDSGVTDQAYLGVNFAVHSSLLIILSWLLPFFMQKKLKPSMEKVALSGLKKGLQAGLAAIEVELIQKIEENKAQREKRAGKLKELISQCEIMQPDSGKIENETLTRMLLES